jgi:hypothetical protein
MTKIPSTTQIPAIPAPASTQDAKKLQTSLNGIEHLLGSLTAAQQDEMGRTGKVVLTDGTQIRASGQDVLVNTPDGTQAAFTWNAQNKMTVREQLQNGATLTNASMSGNGAPWSTTAAQPVLPPPPPLSPEKKIAHDQSGLAWATAGLNAALDPKANGASGGHSVDEWRALVAQEDKIVHQDGVAPKAPPAAPVTANQAAEMLTGKAFPNAQWLTDAKDIISGRNCAPTNWQLASLGLQLAVLKQQAPSTYSTVMTSLASTYGSSAADKVRATIESMPYKYAKDPATQKMGWYDTQQGKFVTESDIRIHFEGASEQSALSSLPTTPNLVTAQSTASAGLLTPKSGFDNSGGSWMADAQSIISGRVNMPNSTQRGGLGVNLAQMSINSPEAFKFVMSSLQATYGNTVSQKINDLISKMPFVWGKNPANGQNGWFTKPGGAAQTETNVYDYFKNSNDWPWKEELISGKTVFSLAALDPQSTQRTVYGH